MNKLWIIDRTIIVRSCAVFSFLFFFFDSKIQLTVQNATGLAAQKMKFSNKDFFSKCDQIRRKLPIWSLKKSLMENFIFCVVACVAVLFNTYAFVYAFVMKISQTEISNNYYWNNQSINNTYLIAYCLILVFVCSGFQLPSPPPLPLKLLKKLLV